MRRDGLNPKVLDQQDRSQPFRKPKKKKRKNGKGGDGDGKKKKKKPTGKAFHWTVSEDQKVYDDSVFSQFKLDDLAQGLDEDFKSLFLERRFSPKSMAAARKKAAAERKKKRRGSAAKVTVLDAKRARNIAISIAKFRKLEPYGVDPSAGAGSGAGDDVPSAGQSSTGSSSVVGSEGGQREKGKRKKEKQGGGCMAVAPILLRLDPDALDEEMLATLSDVLPTDSEVKALHRFRGDRETLMEADRFLLSVLAVPRLPAKVHCLRFAKTFPVDLAETRRRATCVATACDEITGSEGFRTFLKVVLLLGNEMNKGRGKGVSKGFSMASLMKLSQTKSFGNKMSMLQYCIQFMFKKWVVFFV